MYLYLSRCIFVVYAALIISFTRDCWSIAKGRYTSEGHNEVKRYNRSQYLLGLCVVSSVPVSVLVSMLVQIMAVSNELKGLDNEGVRLVKMLVGTVAFSPAGFAEVEERFPPR